jgi:hypothetical protein
MEYERDTVDKPNTKVIDREVEVIVKWVNVVYVERYFLH